MTNNVFNLKQTTMQDHNSQHRNTNNKEKKTRRVICRCGNQIETSKRTVTCECGSVTNIYG